ncbi:hypothetical protein [Phenylobacterium sp.]|uniref:hypothetical protein n=1 Tax=Phenylobacterium sp. TaxID=1871053 RepID=UPI0027332B0C|nr:hypothetical protein [Phenylobacterium sp.]MDP3658586.1 hypothetical protein [Phenylobacterium sp.]
MTVRTGPVTPDIDNAPHDDSLDRVRQMLAAAGRDFVSNLRDATAGAQDRTRQVVESGGRRARTLSAAAASTARTRPAATTAAVVGVLGVAAAAALLTNARTRKASLAAAENLWRRYGHYLKR